MVVNGKFRGDEDLEELDASEVAVLGFSVCTLELDHTVIETQEVWLGEILRTDAFVAEFSKEAPVAVVDGIGNETQVIVMVVGRNAIDMIDLLAIRNRSDPRHIDGTGDEDVLMVGKHVMQ